MTLLLLVRSHGSSVHTYQTPVSHWIEEPLHATAQQHRINRTFGTLTVGKTLFRVDGVWHMQHTPTVAQLAAADMVLLGGHEHILDGDTVAELAAAGIVPLRT